MQNDEIRKVKRFSKTIGGKDYYFSFEQNPIHGTELTQYLIRIKPLFLPGDNTITMQRVYSKSQKEYAVLDIGEMLEIDLECMMREFVKRNPKADE